MSSAPNAEKTCLNDPILGDVFLVELFSLVAPPAPQTVLSARNAIICSIAILISEKMLEVFKSASPAQFSTRNVRPATARAAKSATFATQDSGLETDAQKTGSVGD